jgi:hypothetical protein
MTNDTCNVCRAVVPINPDHGSKAARGTKSKNPASLNPRVLRLLKDLRDFENPWNVQ